MNSKKIRRHLSSLSLDGKVPPSLIVLQLYGLTATDIATAVNRSPNQMSYYWNGLTPIPPIVQARLGKLLEEALKINQSMNPTHPDTVRLLDAIAEITERVLEVT